MKRLETQTSNERLWVVGMVLILLVMIALEASITHQLRKKAVKEAIQEMTEVP